MLVSFVKQREYFKSVGTASRAYMGCRNGGTSACEANEKPETGLQRTPCLLKKRQDAK
jgi:hypothetical protein